MSRNRRAMPPESNDSKNKSTASENVSSPPASPCSVLLAAFSPAAGDETGRQCEDRWEITGGTIIVGRKEPSDIVMDDRWMSGEHFEISRGDNFYIKDINSKNGTFLNGMPLRPGIRQALKEGAVIRAGRSIFVFHHDAKELLAPVPFKTFAMAGCFHLAPLIEQLKRVAAGSAHVLLSGPTGAGKEPAAKAIAALSKKEIIIYNAALFSTEDEAVSTLFGVGPNVFTGVAERTGLIEQADGKILFLDEAHHLFGRTQKSLLRVLEDSEITRIGETHGKKVQVRFILASNELSVTYGIAHDLAARLSVISIPSLKDRIADVPSIFCYLLRKAASEADLDADRLLSAVRTDCWEALCLDGFSFDNVRGLIKLAREIVSEMQIREDADCERIIHTVFQRRFAENPVFLRRANAFNPGPSKKHMKASRKAPKKNKDAAEKTGLPLSTIDLIVEHYYARQGNVTALKAALDKAGVPLARRRISKVLDLLNLPRVKRPRRLSRFELNNPGKEC